MILSFLGVIWLLGLADADESEHSYLVAFLLKPDVSPKSLLTVVKTDRSTERFLCSGTILNRRWILTKAKPIAYLRVVDYWFIVEGQFALPVDDSSLTKYDVSWVLHDNYIEEENVAQNLALARSALEITFEVTSVSLGAPDGHSFTNCRLVLWNWESDDSQSGLVTKTEIPVRFPVRHLCRGAHSGPERHFSCIQRDLRRPPYEFFKPCAINLGAPIVCDVHLLWGVFLGNMEESQCKGDKFQGEYVAFEIYRDDSTALRWIRSLMGFAEEDLEQELAGLKDYDDGSEHEVYERDTNDTSDSNSTADTAEISNSSITANISFTDTTIINWIPSSTEQNSENDSFIDHLRTQNRTTFYFRVCGNGNKTQWRMEYWFILMFILLKV